MNNTEVALFADENAMFVRSKDVKLFPTKTKHFQPHLNEIQKWEEKWSKQLNSLKKHSSPFHQPSPQNSW